MCVCAVYPQKGLNPKFVLLTNPNNPLAVIYSPAVMLRTIQWARKRAMQTIVDEIYALSTHRVSLTNLLSMHASLSYA
jgi:aspartate/methionine/tyrosine aminotransferase